MEYIDCFIGGPFDGRREASRTGQSYHTVRIRQHVQNGTRVMAVYQWQESHTTEQSSERRYRYFRSLPRNEAMQYLAANTKLVNE